MGLRRRKLLTANICGHKTARKGDVTAFGETIQTNMPLEDNGNPDYCLTCIAGMAIQCGLCGRPIFIGDMVWRFIADDIDELPQKCHVYSEQPRTVVACTRTECCATIASVSGTWLPDDNGSGYVHRRPSVFETLASSGDPNQIAIVDDIRRGDATRLLER